MLGAGSLAMTLENRTILRFNRRVRGLQQLGARDDHDVQADGCLPLVKPENLSNQSFSTISPDRSADPSGGDDAESIVPEIVRQEKSRHQPASDPRAVLVNALKLGTPPDPFVRPESPSGG